MVTEVEKQLLIWKMEKQLASDNILEAVIHEQAKRLCTDLRDTPGPKAKIDSFKAGGGGGGWINLRK